MMQEDKLKALFRNQNDVRLAYIFGSYAQKKEKPLSDIDIAVLFDKDLSKKEMFDLKLKLINKLSSILKTDKIDLVVMNNSSTNLNFEIIKHGKILFFRSNAERTSLESRILSKYLDRTYYDRRGLNEFLVELLRRGRL